MRLGELLQSAASRQGEPLELLVVNKIIEAVHFCESNTSSLL